MLLDTRPDHQSYDRAKNVRLKKLNKPKYKAGKL